MYEFGRKQRKYILDDANLNKYMDVIVTSRMHNTGQCCIAAKRFIVLEEIYDTFLENFTSKIKGMKSGDSSKKNTDIGVLARKDLANNLQEQIEKSIKKDAKVHFGNTKIKTCFQPTILTNVTPGMPVFDEETVGPVACFIKVKNKEEAYQLASNSKLGLGAVIFTKDIEDAKKHIANVEDGFFFINELAKSDPRLPF